MSSIRNAFLCLLLWLPCASASAALVSVDADPQTPGIQDSRNVDLGATFTVDLALDAGVDEVWGYELDLAPGETPSLSVIATANRLLDPLLLPRM